MKNGWRKNFRANLRLWPTPTANVVDVARLDGQRYDEGAFVERLNGGTSNKHPTDGRAVRQTVEALALAGLGYREESSDIFRLTPLGRVVFSELAKPSPNHAVMAAMIANAVVQVAEYQTVLSLILACDNKLTNDELNRCMPQLHAPSDVHASAQLVKVAREKSDPELIGPQAYQGGNEQRKAINPWFLLSGGGGILISVSKNNPFRCIEPAALAAVKAALAKPTPSPIYVSSDTAQAKGLGFVQHLSNAGISGATNATITESNSLAPALASHATHYPNMTTGPAVTLLSSSSTPPSPISASSTDPWASGVAHPPNDDPTEVQNYARKVRRGQPQFRSRLLAIYEGRCAISGYGPEAVLQAAHILPHSETGLNDLGNGLLLRADLHELMDEGLLFIEPDTFIVRLAPSLRETEYWCFEGKMLRARIDRSTLSSDYLQERWKKRLP